MRVARTVAVVLLGFGWMAHGASAQQPTASQLAAMKAEYRRPAAKPVENLALVDLGRELFWDPRASASGKTACATCHLPNLGWGVLEARSRNDSGKLTSRKSQPLIGIGHMQASGRLGRSQRQPRGAGEVIDRHRLDVDARDRDAGEGRGDRAALPRHSGVCRAVQGGAAGCADHARHDGAGDRSLRAHDGARHRAVRPLDRGRRERNPESAKRGFVLFSRKATLFRLSSGWRFTDDKFHDIGTTTTMRPRARGEGRREMQFAFKTPTLAVGRDASALHAQRLVRRPLWSVKHYEKGGIDRPSRSPLLVPIGLSEQERLDLVAFMETLSGSPEGEPAPKLPELHTSSIR